MSRLLTLAVLGFAGFSLAAPQTSRAQTPVGVQVQVGPGVISYQRPVYVAPTYVTPTYVQSAPVVIAQPAPVVVTPSVYVGWRWDGHRWYRGEHHRRYYR